MPNKQREFTPEQLAQAQRLYEQTGAGIKAVAGCLGISTTTLRNRMALWGWTPRSTRQNRSVPRTGAKKKPAAGKKPGIGKNAADPVRDKNAGESQRPSPWQGQPCTGLAACPERTALIARLWASVSRQIARIDAAHAAFVAQGGQPNAAEAEGHAKLIAALARTMRELATLDAALQDKSQEERSAHDSNAGRNADAFRDELAKRLAALETSGEKKTAGVTDAG